MDILTVNQFVKQNPAFTEGGIRWDIFNAEKNGLKQNKVIIRKGRRVYIVPERYFAWLELQNS